MLRRLLPLFLLLINACTSTDQRANLLNRSEQVRSDVYWLADDARTGRLPGTQGADDTAAFIHTRFTDLGLKPFLPDQSFQQHFTIARTRSILPGTMLDHAELGKDFTPLNFSGSASFSGQIVFAGYGVRSDKYQYDDYKDLDAKGKVVLAMRYEPHDADGKSRFTHSDFTGAAAMLEKADLAHKQGAVALLLVNPPLFHDQDAPLRKFESFIGTPGTSPIPIISISPTYAQQLLGHLDLLSIQKQIDQTGSPQSQLINQQLAGNIQLGTQSIKTRNIIAMLPGTGPRKNEYIVIGAHYDHLGDGKISSHADHPGEIHNGADDNASGIAALLDLARALSMHRLDRSIVFAAFSGEESGLLGSRYFVDHLPIAPEKIRAMINLDMVGRVRHNILYVGGAGTDPTFRKLLTDANHNPALQLESLGDGGLGPSDHQSFALRKIPVLFLFTGMHEEYHHPDDDALRINFQGIQQISSLVQRLVEKLSTDTRQPYVDTFDQAGMKTDVNPDKPSTNPSKK